jgi:23S rRNA-/tRNA-specific pseudouridylate synthase
VNTGDQVSAGIMESGRFRELELPSSAILYQDSELVALAKPTGIPSQRTPYQLKGTMEYWVSQFLQQHGKQEPARIVHRLDRGTSGVMLFPKHRQGAARLSALFKDGEIEKYYLAVVSGTPAQEWWEVEGNIAKLGSARWGINPAGRPAKTGFRLLEHEATTSKISEDQIFYCNQRGISTEDAIGLIVNGYAKEVLNKLPMEFAVEAQKLLTISLEGSVG